MSYLKNACTGIGLCLCLNSNSATLAQSFWYTNLKIPKSPSKHTIQAKAMGPYLDIIDEFQVNTNPTDTVLAGTIVLKANQTPLGVAIDVGNGYQSMQALTLNQNSSISLAETKGHMLYSDTWYNQSLHKLDFNSIQAKQNVKFRIHYLQSPDMGQSFIINPLNGPEYAYSLNLDVSQGNWKRSTGVVSGRLSLDLETADTLINTGRNRIWLTQLSGDLSGNYLYWNSTIPDSVKEQFRQNHEVSILWRWNSPKNFFNLAGDLNTTGQLALNQAQSLKNYVEYLYQQGQSVGLIHSVFQEKPHTFPMHNNPNLVQDSILNWLQWISEQQLRSKYYTSEQTNSNPSWKPLNIQKNVSEVDSLFAHMKIAVGQFSNKKGIMRKILLISPDGETDTHSSFDIDSLDHILNQADLQTLGSWNGTPMGSLTHNTINPIKLLSEAVPTIYPNRYNIQINGDANYTIDTNAQFFARSKGTWNPTVKILGQFDSFKRTDTILWNPTIEQLNLDSNLVRIWANVGQKLGGKVLDSVESKLSMLQVGPLYGLLNTYDPNLLSSGSVEIKTTATLNTLFNTPNWKMNGNNLMLQLPASEWTIEAYDAQGRSINHWNLKGEQLWQFSLSSNPLVVFLRLRDKNLNTWTLNLRGLL